MKYLLYALILTLLVAGPVHADMKEAAEHNQNGLEALKAQAFDAAIKEFKLALVYAPNEPIITKNLANAYNAKGTEIANMNQLDKAIRYIKMAQGLVPEERSYHKNISMIQTGKASALIAKKRWHQARKALKVALEYNSRNPIALSYMGDTYYYTQDLSAAKKYWEDALQSKPDPVSAEIVKEKLAQLIKELAVEKGLAKYPSLYFDIRFERGAKEYDAKDIKDSLVMARQKIGQDFHYYPANKTIVLLYPEGEFEKMRRMPEWVAGLYDGKIRLPIKQKKYSHAQLKALLWHEYTHALIHSLAGPNIPAWLNEGLAKYEETKGVGKISLKTLEKALKADQAIPLSRLTGGTLQADPALLYEQSYSVVKFLIDKWHFYKVNAILGDLKKGLSINEAFQKELFMSLGKFEKKWREEMRKKYGY